MSEQPPEPQARDWSLEVKNRLKAEMKLRGMSYADLAQALDRVGVQETAVNLRNKLSRGGFTAAFFFQCVEAMGGQIIITGQMSWSGPFASPSVSGRP